MLTVLLSLFILLQPPVTVQPDSVTTLGDEQIANHTTYFNIEDGRFSDADSLLRALNQAHFVALGELHNRVRLGELTDALLRYLHSRGFQNFGVETGPYSAQKLEQLIRLGESDVSRFYDRYSSKLFNIYPIPFFTGKADLKFLSTADSLDYDLWGLDQEFAFSYSYLIDELASLSNRPLSDRQEELHRELSSTLFRWNRRAQIFSGFDMNCRLLQDSPLPQYLESFSDSEDPQITAITDGLRTSLNIYCLAEQRKGSSRVRIDYFKENFDINYQQASENHPDPKVFLKMGSYHSGREKSPLGLYDIGNHMQNLADSIDQKSVHIRYLNRYYRGKDMVNEKGWESSKQFIQFGRKTEWTLIDLRPIRSLLKSQGLQASEFKRRLIRNYDFIIIAPSDDRVEPHY